VRGEFRPHPAARGTETPFPGLVLRIDSGPAVAVPAATTACTWETRLPLPSGRSAALHFTLTGAGLTNALAWLGRVTGLASLQRFRAQNKNRQLRVVSIATSTGEVIFDFSNRHTPYSTAYARRHAKLGLNIVGFLTAELGVGESARCMVRAADAAGNASLQSVRVTVADVNETPAKVVYGALLPNGDRTLSLAVTPGAQPAFATTDRVGSDTLPLAAWRNALTGDWFYAPAGQAMPYACYVAAADPGLGRVLAPGQGAFDVHLYLRADGLTQEMSQAAAQQLGLLSQGYVDQGALFASVALVGVAA